MIHLRTDRLEFRQWQESDYKPLAKYFDDERSARYVGGRKTPEQAWRLMATYIGHYQLNGYSYLALVETATDQLVGTVGLWNSEPWPEMELGYWLLDDMQGKGYAAEAARKVKEYAFLTLKTDSLVSYIDSGNQPSINLALKLGAVRDQDIELLDFGPHQVFRYAPPDPGPQNR